MNKNIAKKPRSPLFSWDWRTFVLVATTGFAMILAIQILSQNVSFFAENQITLTLVSAIGLIPAMFAGVAPMRKSRKFIIILAILIPVLLGLGVCAKEFLGEPGAIIFMALIGFAASMMVAKSKWIGLNFIAPIAAIGLSYDEMGVPIGFLILMLVAGGLAFVISQFFPNFTSAAPEPKPAVAKKFAVQFGILYGLALALATFVSFRWDHTGWVVGSVALVMRPFADMQKFRSAWRIVAILVGVSLASLVLWLNLAPLATAIISVGALSLFGGLHKSRAYVGPAFVTFSVFLFLEYPAKPGEISHWFLQRMGEVILGVLIAYVVGLAIPALAKMLAKKPAPQIEPELAE